MKKRGYGKRDEKKEERKWQKEGEKQGEEEGGREDRTEQKGKESSLLILAHNFNNIYAYRTSGFPGEGIKKKIPGIPVR